MGDISDKDQEMLIILSTIFVDNQIDYEYIKNRLNQYPISDIEIFFFKYIVPICGSNFKTPIPDVIYYFDEEFLFEEYRRLKKNELSNQDSLFQKIKYHYVKWRYKKYWQDLQQHLLLKS